MVRMEFLVPTELQQYPQGRLVSSALELLWEPGDDAGLSNHGVAESRGKEGPEGEGTREQDLAGLEALEPRRVCPLLSLPVLRTLPRPPITSKALTQSLRQATPPMQAEEAPLDRRPGTPGSLSC